MITLEEIWKRRDEIYATTTQSRRSNYVGRILALDLIQQVAKELPVDVEIEATSDAVDELMNFAAGNYRGKAAESSWDPRGKGCLHDIRAVFQYLEAHVIMKLTQAETGDDYASLLTLPWRQRWRAEVTCLSEGTIASAECEGMERAALAAMCQLYTYKLNASIDKIDEHDTRYGRDRDEEEYVD